MTPARSRPETRWKQRADRGAADAALALSELRGDTWLRVRCGWAPYERPDGGGEPGAKCMDQRTQAETRIRAGHGRFGSSVPIGLEVLSATREFPVRIFLRAHRMKPKQCRPQPTRSASTITSAAPISRPRKKAPDSPLRCRTVRRMAGTAGRCRSSSERRAVVMTWLPRNESQRMNSAAANTCQRSTAYVLFEQFAISSVSCRCSARLREIWAKLFRIRFAALITYSNEASSVEFIASGCEVNEAGRMSGRACHICRSRGYLTQRPAVVREAW
jgi:hypothetical protein